MTENVAKHALKASPFWASTGEVRAPSIDVLLAAPVSASLVVQNGTNGKFTITAVAAAAATQNAITFTMVDGGTNTASIAVVGSAITATINTSGTNTSTASNVVALIAGNTNVSALVTAATNTAGVMAAAAVQSLAGGTDGVTVKSTKSVASCVRTGVGLFTLTLNDPIIKYNFHLLQVHPTSLSSLTGIDTVFAIAGSNANTFQLLFVNFSDVASDVAQGGSLKGWLVGHNTTI